MKHDNASPIPLTSTTYVQTSLGVVAAADEYAVRRLQVTHGSALGEELGVGQNLKLDRLVLAQIVQQ